MGNLRYTVDEDGKRVWRLEENDGGDERHLEAPCESMRRLRPARR